MSKQQKVLVVAAHPDDEVLGVGGTILKHASLGDEVSVLILADGETSREGGGNIEKRKVQCQKAAEALGAKEVFLEGLPDNKCDSVPLLDVVKIIEKHLNNIKPSIVYTHNVTDLNIDHQITAKAVVTAARPKPGYFVKEILAFEVASSTEWQLKDKTNQFCPTVYNDISDFIEKKIEALKVYDNELCDYPHPRSEQGVRILAQYRGIESGYKFAEAFQLLRKLID